MASDMDFLGDLGGDRVGDPEGSRELLEKVTNGDRDALARLVAQLAPLIRSQVRRRAPRAALEAESVDDLAQSVCREVLERVRRGAVVYQGEEAFRAWLVGAVDLKLGERWRRAHSQRRDGDLGVAALGSVDVAGDATSPSGAFARGEDREKFIALLDRLPEDDRAIVLGVHIDGRSHADIAAELAITESHSRTKLARALARLATYMSPPAPQ